MAKLYNRVGEQTATIGTGTVTLAGDIDESYTTFAEAGVQNADVVTYLITEGNDFEIGRGTYTSAGTTLSRDTVLISKIGGTAGTTKMSLAGAAEVRISAAREDHVAHLVTFNATEFLPAADATHSLGSTTLAWLNLFLTGVIELGHDNDTTLARSAAGAVTIEGQTILTSANLATTTEVLTGTDTAKPTPPNSIAALWEKGANIASAATISIGEGGYFHVTGTTTITDIDFATATDGRSVILEFDGALTLTHNATTLKLPGAANITTAAGDTCCVVQDAGDNIRVAYYQRAAGGAIGAQALDATLTALAAFNTNGLLTQTAADTFAGRTITGTANQITVTDGNGVAGNPTLSLHADVYRVGGTDVALADGGTGTSLTDPGADRVMAWDDSAGVVKFTALADFNSDDTPVAGDKFLYYTAAGALVVCDAGSLPAGAPSSTRRTITAADTVVASDRGNLIEITSGTFTLAFTAAATLGSGFYVDIYNSGTGDVTLDPNASEQIDGLTSWILYPGGAVTVRCTGTDFQSVLIAPMRKQFDSSGTFTKPGVGVAAKISLWGGGGSGAKGAASNSGGGGGGGAFNELELSLTTLGATETVTIGAGGVGQTTASTSGNVGGTSTFGSLLSAFGGGGGAMSGTGGGGGGGGGTLAAGSTAVGTVGGAGGGPLGGASGSPPTESIFGGGGGGNAGGPTAGARSSWGGGGGGGALDAAGPAGAGGASTLGGGGGGGSANSGSGGAGGVSTFGGNGSAGTVDANNSSAGTAPGGGSGGTETGNSGAGGAGRCVVIVR